jgi:hypothetical protein
VAERLNAPVLKTGSRRKAARGFESHPLRQSFEVRTSILESDPAGSLSFLAERARIRSASANTSSARLSANSAAWVGQLGVHGADDFFVGLVVPQWRITKWRITSFLN